MRTGLLLLLLVSVPAPASAWGVAAHKYIMGRAIDLLPAEVRPFFDHYRDELVLRVNDPDTWRVAGWEDGPNHFVDFGRPDLGPYPFAALPRDYNAAVEKFGVEMLKRIGMLPWREAEEFGNLRRAFEGFKRNDIYAPSDTVLFAAVASHYIQDAHMPLHASNNNDGQLTGQTGVHARFETALFERYQSKLTINPVAIASIASPRDAAFDTLLASHQLVERLLQADKQASIGRDSYDDVYFERFFVNARPILEQQITLSISTTAALVTGAWEQAGKPALRTTVAPATQRVR
ncbi:MAG TPA: hypothetical protein VGJ39_07040 [Vicinamibacterales bacterium]